MGAKIAVIGAGIGGLTSAALLAARGHTVTLIEKEDWVGGKAREVDVDGAMIAGGPTVFTMRDVFEQVFETCGASLDDYIAVSQAEIIARHAWDETGTLDLFSDPAKSEESIGAFAGAREARAFRAFRAEAKLIFDVLEKPFLRGDSASSPLPMMWRMGPTRMGDAMAMRPFDILWKALGQHFSDARLQQLFGRYSTYCGSDPYQSPATLMLIAHTEAKGVWLIEGGIHALARALRDLAERCGVRVRLGEGVSEVLTSGARVRGVRLSSGEEIAADAVISNADPAALSTGALGQGARRSVAHMPASKRSLSAYVWYAHAETSGFDLTHHNVFFSRNYAREFRRIAGGQTPDEPTVYVCAQDRAATMGAQAGPKGRERLQIIVNAPANGDTHIHTDKEIEACTRAMRETLARCGLSLEQNCPQKVMTPTSWETLFPATGGALYGRASHGWAASFQRQGPRTKTRGLYCTGGATHPAAGVPMAALSGLLAAKVVGSDLASMRTSRPVATPGGTSTRSARTGSTA